MRAVLVASVVVIGAMVLLIGYLTVRHSPSGAPPAELLPPLPHGAVVVGETVHEGDPGGPDPSPWRMVAVYHEEMDALALGDAIAEAFVDEGWFIGRRAAPYVDRPDRVDWAGPSDPDRQYEVSMSMEENGAITSPISGVPLGAWYVVIFINRGD
jgi:hypothetical protein